jgi:hypothetical protein
LTSCHTRCTLYDMKTHVVQARIDSATAKLLARLRRQTGKSDSELVRKGLELLGEMSAPAPRRRVRGLGKFASGQPDLGSNKRHLAGFGRS